ncbi:MAG TPA: hypothetical protein VFQ61_31485 [Polyangiaceae bacterium]|nr:hypothetical protein [Polyangiaceae bacterium]
MFTSKGNPKLTSNSLFFGAESFIRQYPQIAQRVVKALVASAKWAADQESDPAPVFQLWTRSGSTFSSYKEDWTGESLKYKLSPLLDPYVVTRHTFQIEQAKRLGLIRRSFDFGEMVNPTFLSAALKELALVGFWKPRDAQTGKPAS